MSLRSPQLEQLKTELLAILDYLQPSLPVTDGSGNVIAPRGSVRTQSDDVRSALTANMLAELLGKIGKVKPSEIEVSARFLKEITKIAAEYERAIAPLTNIVSGEDSITQALRTLVANLVQETFPGLPRISESLSETPTAIVEASLSPFYPEARAFGAQGNELQDTLSQEAIRQIWGTLYDFRLVDTPNFLVRNNPIARRQVTEEGSPVLDDSTGDPRPNIGRRRKRRGSGRRSERGSEGRTGGGNAPGEFSADEGVGGIVGGIGSGFTGDSSPSEDSTTANQELLFEPEFPITRFGTGPFVDMETFSRSSPRRFLSMALDWLSQMAAMQQVFPDMIGKSDSAHSLLTQEALNGDRLGIANSLLFNFTTSDCFKVRIDTSAVTRRPPRRARTTTHVTTDRGYPDALDRVGTTFRFRGKTPLLTFLDAPENVLRTDVVTSLRDGFILDTPVAIEEGFEGATENPLQGDDYQAYTERFVEERNDLAEFFRETIVGPNSPLTSGRPGDYVPGLSARTLLDTGVGFRGAKFLAVREALGAALQHDSCVLLASLFVPNAAEAELCYLGSRITFGDQWCLNSIQRISQIFTNAYIRNSMDIENMDLDDETRTRVEALEARIDMLINREHFSPTYPQIIEMHNEIEELRSNFFGARYRELARETLQILIDMFPYDDALIDEVNEELIDDETLGNLSSPFRYIGLSEGSSIVRVNLVSTLDPTFEEEVENGERVPSLLLDEIDAVVTELIRDCANRITALGAVASSKDVGNYAYMYFMSAGQMASSVFVPTAPQDRTVDQFAVFSNRVTDLTGGVAVLLNSDQAQRSYAEIDARYGLDIGNTIGFGAAAAEGMIEDPGQASVDFVAALGTLLTNALPNAFSVASEAVNRASQALRQRFGRSITLSSGDTQIALNLLDLLLETTDFSEFKARAESFVDLRTLTPVVLLSSNNVQAGMSLLQFALYALTEAPLTRLENVSFGDFIVPYNKVAAFGIHRELMPLIEALPHTSETRRIRRGFGRLRILERQLDPAPSVIDSITSNDGLMRGSRYLQSIDSAGQPTGGWSLFLEAQLDYGAISRVFSLANPVANVTYTTASPSGRRVLVDERVNLATDIDTTENELLQFARTFIRSEALKIYYYFMTGFIFEPDFAPQPTADDSILTESLISVDPMERLEALVDLFVVSDINQFRQVVLVPFVSDNDSLEEFTGILSFDT